MSEARIHLVFCLLFIVFPPDPSVGNVHLRWTQPKTGSFFRADENVEVQLEAAAHPEKHISVEIFLDGETIGVFDMPLDGSNSPRVETEPGYGRTMRLTLGAVSLGFHEITAATNTTTSTDTCEADGGEPCFRKAETTNKFEVGEGKIALLFRGDERSSNQSGTREIVLDKWGCVLVGGVVTGRLPSTCPHIRYEMSDADICYVVARRRLYLYLNGVRYKTTEGWVNTPWLPGPLQVRGAFTDDWGDILVENTTTVNVVSPPTLFGRPSEAELALRGMRLEAARAIPSRAARAFRPLISCLHPTRGRPQDALATRASWMATAAQPTDVEWVFAVDSDDEESISTLSHECESLSEPARVVVVPLAALYHGEGTCVGAWNFAALGASGEILLSVADDFHPPTAWDDKVLSRTPLDAPAVLMINDRLSSCRSIVSDDTDEDMPDARQQHDRSGVGKEKEWWADQVRSKMTPHAYGVLQSHPVLNRERYEQVGYVLYPEYESVYCDDDFTMWASKDGVEVDGFDVEFDHRHSVNGKQVQDRDPAAMHPTTFRNNLGERYLRGLQTFKRRLSASYLQQRGISRIVPRRFEGGAAWSDECKTSVSLLITFSSIAPPPAHAVLAQAVHSLQNSDTRLFKDCVELLAIRSHASNSTLAALAKNRLLDAARGSLVTWIGPWELDCSGSEFASRIFEGVEAETLVFELAKRKTSYHGAGDSGEERTEASLRALSILDVAREYAKTKQDCRWSTLGLVLRHIAALVRFRPVEDSDDDHLRRLCMLLGMEKNIVGESNPDARELASSTGLVWRHSEHDAAPRSHSQLNHDDERKPVARDGGREESAQAAHNEGCWGLDGDSGLEHGSGTEWDVGPTQVELERTRRYLQVTSPVGSVALQCQDCPWADILEPEQGADLVFGGYSSKSWSMVAAVHGLTISEEGAMACVYLDGDYKGCEAGAGMRSWAEMSSSEGLNTDSEDGGWFEMVFDDPGLDGSWHRLEVRLLDAHDELIGVTATAEFRARLEACSAPITARIQAGLASEGVGVVECHSRLEDGPFPLANVAMVDATGDTSTFVAVRETGWADTDTLATVMSIPNYRRWVVEGHMAAGSQVARLSNYVQLQNSWIVYPGHVVTANPSNSSSFVMYNLQGACDDRNMAPPPLAQSQHVGQGAIVLSQLWGDNFYHWMIECLPRLAALPRSIVDDPAIVVIVPSDSEFTVSSLRLAGIASNRVRRLDHATVYFANSVYHPDCGVCGIGPSAFTLRRASTWLRQGLAIHDGGAPPLPSLQIASPEAVLIHAHYVRWAGLSQTSTCLLVQRAHGARSLLNHDALLLALRASNLPCAWSVLDPVSDNAPGRMEFAAGMFASSKVIVSPHGGSLSNLLFSSSYTTLLELLPQFRPNLCYERLCRALGIRYVGLSTPESSMKKPWSVHIPSVLKTMRSIVRADFPSPKTRDE